MNSAIILMGRHDSSDHYTLVMGNKLIATCELPANYPIEGVIDGFCEMIAMDEGRLELIIGNGYKSVEGGLLQVDRLDNKQAFQSELSSHLARLVKDRAAVVPETRGLN